MRRSLSALSWIVAVFAVFAGFLHGLMTESLRSPWAITGLAVFAVALVVSIPLHHTPRLVVATVVFAVLPTAGALIAEYRNFNSALIDILLIIALVSLVFGLTQFVRKRLGSRASAVAADGVIVAMGAWVLVWVVLVRPLIDGNLSPTLTILRGASLGIAIVVVFLLVTLVFSDTTPSVSVAFSGIAIALGLSGVIVRALSFRDDLTITNATYTAPFVMAILFVAAALLHPSIRQIETRATLRLSPPLMTRLVTTTISLIAPIIVLALTDAHDAQDRIVRTASVAVLAIAAMTRIIQSVRSNAHTQERLVRNALTDSLTGLPNRVLLLEHIETAMHKSWRTSKQPTVLFIDVDRFKNINDSLGHSIGDDVLMHVASRLLTSVNSSSTVARISGDEFVVLDPTTESPTQSVLIAEAILDAFREPITTPEGDMFITASIGVAYSPKDLDLNADDLLRHADTAMYRAKAAGRNCIALFDESMLQSVSQRLEVETALYRALERNELHLVHQPIVDINLGIVVGFEALMRWKRSDGDNVSPAEFIPIAEETGTIVPLGSWAIRDALTHLRQWIETGVVSPSTTMSVNVSPRQLIDPQFVTVVRDAVSVTGVRPDQVWLEVTESVMITEPAQALSALRQLNSLGVRVAIDDFGTGYSSLSTLRQFPIQGLKIDRAFVQALTNTADTHTLVKTILAMADTLGAEVVAEGIETQEQLQILKSLNCTKAQGFYLGKPLAVDDVPAAVHHIHAQHP